MDTCSAHRTGEWITPQPSRRPDIFPEFERLQTPLPKPLPGDPEVPDEEEEEEKEKKPDKDPEEDPDKPKPDEPAPAVEGGRVFGRLSMPWLRGTSQGGHVVSEDEACVDGRAHSLAGSCLAWSRRWAPCFLLLCQQCSGQVAGMLAGPRLRRTLSLLLGLRPTSVSFSHVMTAMTTGPDTSCGVPPPRGGATAGGRIRIPRTQRIPHEVSGAVIMAVMMWLKNRLMDLNPNFKLKAATASTKLLISGVAWLYHYPVSYVSMWAEARGRPGHGDAKFFDYKGGLCCAGRVVETFVQLPATSFTHALFMGVISFLARSTACTLGLGEAVEAATLEAVVCAAVVLGVRIFHLGSRYIGAGTLEAWIEKGQLETARVEASIWEQHASLTDAQQQAVDLLAALCDQRPLPSKVLEEGRSPSAAPSAEPSPVPPSPTAGGAPPSPSSAAPPSPPSAAAAAAQRAELAGLAGSFAGTSFEDVVDEALALLGRLKDQHYTVAARTGALHGQCERLVSERERLMELADAIRSKLSYFDEVERVAAQFHAASVSPDSTDFLPLLKRLDDCIAYVAANPQYADASTYALKFRQLQARALTAVRTKVLQVLKAATASVAAAMKDGRGAPAAPTAAAANGAAPPRAASAAEGAEAALLYVRFRAAAEPALKGLLAGVEVQAGSHAEYARLLADCQELYAEARLGLMRAPLAARIRGLAAQPLPALTRDGCVLLMQARGAGGRGRRARANEARCAARVQPAAPQFRPPPPSRLPSPHGARASHTSLPPLQTCQQEVQLYEHFFPRSSAASGAGLSPLVDPLCMLLYDALRPRLVTLQDIDGLCELVGILKGEVLEEALGRRSDAAAPLEPMLLRTLADIQERLTFRRGWEPLVEGFCAWDSALGIPRLGFCAWDSVLGIPAQACIKDEVAGFVPKPADLDYPALLQRHQQQQQASAAAGTEAAAFDGAAPDGAGAAGGAPPEADAGAAAYATWYPPVQRALLLLSKLYRAVDARIFNGLAHEAVAAATAAVQDASARILKARERGWQWAGGGEVRGQTHLVDGWGQVLEASKGARHGRRPAVCDQADARAEGADRAFRGGLRGDNAVVQLLGGKGAPRLLESQADAKRELERTLKATCEAFIMHVTKLSVEPMLSFITKVTAVRVAAGGGGDGPETKPLREQAFASPERLAELVGKVNEALGGALPAAAAALRLYLPSAATRAILLKPIKNNILEAHAQIAALVEGEYAPEEAAAIGLTPADPLNALLDSLA
eukprot:scaffold15.g4229.t1